MTLSKFILWIGFFTFVCILYVFQQTEIFRLAYSGQKRMSVFQELLDKNSILRYNIERSGSLTRIGNKISRSIEFEMPASFRLVKVGRPGGYRVAKETTKKQTLASRIFSIKRQAEAKTIGP
jgi:hypothetical protein